MASFAKSVRVRFATNRNRLDDHDPEMFGKEFAHANPDIYVTGSIRVDFISGDWYPIESTLIIDQKSDSRIGATAQGIVPQTSATGMIYFISERVGTQNRPSTDFALILIHGFAASFPDSMSRAAQISSEYGARSIFCFSWPANKSNTLIEYYRNYPLDKTDAERSAGAIADVLREGFAYLQSLEAEIRPAISLVAHSMGAFALRGALQRIVRTHAELLSTVILKKIFLMAPDEDLHALEDDQKLRPIEQICSTIAVYWSSGDMALAVSKWFNPEPRLGLYGPYRYRNIEISKNITSVSCSKVSPINNDGLFEHQYYRLSPPVINDVRQVLIDSPQVQPRLIDYEARADGRAWVIPLYAQQAREMELVQRESGVDPSTLTLP